MSPPSPRATASRPRWTRFPPWPRLTVGISRHMALMRSCLLTLATRTLFVSGAGLDEAKRTIEAYKHGRIERLTPEVWQAKKVVDSTLHPG